VPLSALFAMNAGSDLATQVAGVDNASDLANLQLLMGNLGVSGGGVAPLRTQNNSQGACDMGGLPRFIRVISWSPISRLIRNLRLPGEPICR